MLACTHVSPAASEVLTFARSTAGLLDAHLSYYRPLVGDDANCDDVARATEQSGYDLVVREEPDQRLGRRQISGLVRHQARRGIG